MDTPPQTQTRTQTQTQTQASSKDAVPVRHVRRAARAIGPTPIPRSSTDNTASARHTRSQSATPTGNNNNNNSSSSAPGTPTHHGIEAPHTQGVQIEPPPRRSTISVGTLQSPVSLSSSPSGTVLNCPICGVMAPSLFALNEHLDDSHFAGDSSGGNGDGAGRSLSSERIVPAQDDLDDVKGAILGFFRGAGKAVKGLGAIASAGPPSAASSDLGDDAPVAAAVLGDGRWRSGDRDGADKDLVTRAHWQQPKPGARCGLPACAVSLTPHTGAINCRCCGRLMCSQHCMHKIRLSPTAQFSIRGNACRVCAECHLRSLSSAVGHGNGGLSGASRDLTMSFVHLRRKAVSAAHLEGNRIEKRLEKLAIAHGSVNSSQQTHTTGSSTASSVLQLSRGPSAVQAAEQMVVLWEDDNAVQACPFCSKAFGLISSRRHHCRLCGRVVCHRPKCSAMLTIPLPTADNRGFSTDRCADIRACRDCEMIVLRQRDRAARSSPGAMSGGELSVLYTRIRETMNHVEETLPMFNTLALRMRNASSSVTPDLPRATRIRKQLTAAFNDLDNLSKRIAALPAPSPASARLHANIRQTVTQYLQLHMFPLTMLPRPERKQQVAAQVAKTPGDRTPRVPTPLRTQLGADDMATTTVIEDLSPATSAPSSISTAIIPNAENENSQRSYSSDTTTANNRSLDETSKPPHTTTGVGGKASGLASSLLSYVVPRQIKKREQQSSALDENREEMIRRVLLADPGKESRIAAMAMDEKMASLEILRDQRQRVLGYISEAQRERRLEDAISLQSSLSDLDVELSLIERNL